MRLFYYSFRRSFDMGSKSPCLAFIKSVCNYLSHKECCGSDVVKIGVHRQSYKKVLSIEYIGCVTPHSQISNSALHRRSPWNRSYKSLGTNWIFSLRGLSVALTNTHLKPLNNNLQRIKPFCRVTM